MENDNWKYDLIWLELPILHEVVWRGYFTSWNNTYSFYNSSGPCSTGTFLLILQIIGKYQQ